MTPRKGIPQPESVQTWLNPVGDTTTYVIPENSRDTGVTRCSVDNAGHAGLWVFRCSNASIPRAQMARCARCA